MDIIDNEEWIESWKIKKGEKPNFPYFLYKDNFLYIKFKIGRIYKYSNVDLDLWEKILELNHMEKEVGRFLSIEITKQPNKYPFIEIK